MRKSIITTLLLLLAVTCTFAQPAKGPRTGTQPMLEELDLSPEQQEQIKAIKQNARKELQALRQEHDSANHEKAKAIHEQSRKAVEEVLTPEQQVKLADLKAAKKAAWKAVDKEGLKAKLKAYRETNIEPVLRASRSKLDAFIADEDKVEIERLRGVFASRPGKGERRARPEKRADKAAEMAAKREAGKAWREEHAADLESLKNLTEKYQVELDRVQEVLTPSRATWDKEMAEIKAAYLPEGMEGRGQKMGRQKGPAQRQGKRRGAGVERMKAGAFLLMKS
jgi:Spy/CpxP family protein refolding chaperone